MVSPPLSATGNRAPRVYGAERAPEKRRTQRLHNHSLPYNHGIGAGCKEVGLQQKPNAKVYIDILLL
jgi:hypothetical protein